MLARFQADLANRKTRTETGRLFRRLGFGLGWLEALWGKIKYKDMTHRVGESALRVLIHENRKVRELFFNTILFSTLGTALSHLDVTLVLE